MTIRPFKHNEYPRFLVGAYPYYGSIFATIIGLIVFSILFLLHKDKTPMNGSYSNLNEKK